MLPLLIPPHLRVIERVSLADLPARMRGGPPPCRMLMPAEQVRGRGRHILLINTTPVDAGVHTWAIVWIENTQPRTYSCGTRRVALVSLIMTIACDPQNRPPAWLVPFLEMQIPTVPSEPSVHPIWIAPTAGMCTCCRDADDSPIDLSMPVSMTISGQERVLFGSFRALARASQGHHPDDITIHPRVDVTPPVRRSVARYHHELQIMMVGQRRRLDPIWYGPGWKDEPELRPAGMRTVSSRRASATALELIAAKIAAYEETTILGSQRSPTWRSDRTRRWAAAITEDPYDR